MRIIVDAMGGDNAPEAVVQGAVDAGREFGVDITLVGREDAVRSCLQKCGAREDGHMALARVGVFARADGQSAELARKAAVLRKDCGARIDIIPSDPLDISSSEIRAMLPARQGCEYLPDAVYERIIRFRLYGAKPDLACTLNGAVRDREEKSEEIFGLIKKAGLI